MKQQLLRLVNVMYGYIKTPLGLAVSGAMAGSTTSYFFDRTKLAKDLALAHLDKQQLEERILKLENENTDLSRQHRDLSLINSGYVTKSDELRDELRHAAADIAAVREHLNTCNHSMEIFTSELKRNTWFFGGNNVINSTQDASANLEHCPVSAPNANNNGGGPS